MSSEHDFFSQTLKLHQELDFTTVLENAGLVPSTTTEYHVSTFHQLSLHLAQVNTLCSYSPLLGASIMGTHYHTYLLSTNTHNTMQKDDFERAFQTSLGVQPLLECLYSQVGANRKWIFFYVFTELL